MPLAEVLAKVTPGPLVATRTTIEIPKHYPDDPPMLVCMVNSGLSGWQVDAAYLAHAANTLPGLVGALEHARKLVASYDVVRDRAALRMYDTALAAAKTVQLP
jgi:hypothetical protein